MAGPAVESASPERLGNDMLRQQLGAAQTRVRAIMREFNIASGHVCTMARDAERSITHTGLRAEFLRLLIDLHEFAREAKRRGLLRRAVLDGEAAPVQGRTGRGRGRSHSDDGMRLDAPLDEASDAVTEDVSRAFFARLDGASRDRGSMFPNRGQT